MFNKLFSLLPLKMKRRINAKLRDLGLKAETTRKVAVRKPRVKKSAGVDASNSASSTPVQSSSSSDLKGDTGAATPSQS